MTPDEKEVEELANLMISIESKWSDESHFGPGSLSIEDMLKQQAFELIKAGYRKAPDLSKDTLWECIRFIPSTHVPISKINDKTYHYMCKEDIIDTILSHYSMKEGKQ